MGGLRATRRLTDRLLLLRGMVLNTPERGRVNFDATALAECLSSAALEADSYNPLPDSVFDEYNAYYALDIADAEHSFGLLVSHHQRIFVQTFVPRTVRAWAVVCHGYYDHIGLYGNLIRVLLDRDIAVIGFDQIGHGLSSGERVVIDDFQHYVDVMSDVHDFACSRSANLPLHWFGQSMGGALVMEYWQQTPKQALTGEMVLFAPLVRPYGWATLQWYFHIVKYFVRQRPRDVATNMENPEFVALQIADPLQARIVPVSWVQSMVNWFTRFTRYPTSPLQPKVLQGYGDRTVDFRYNMKVIDKLYPDGAIHIIAPARHHMVNEVPEVLSAMWEWLDKACQWHHPRDGSN